jgi:hypothetical protein
MTNAARSMRQNKETIETQPIIIITKTLSANAHGLVVP